LWADEDVPSIEDENIYGEIIVNDDSYAREEMGFKDDLITEESIIDESIVNDDSYAREEIELEDGLVVSAIDSSNRPPQIVTTYPDWASDENFKISDSLSNAIRDLDVQLATPRAREVTTEELDSLSSSAFAKTSQMDALRAELVALQLKVQKDSAVVRGTDTVFVERVVTAPPGKVDSETARRLEAEIARLSREVEDTEAYREQRLKQEENRYKLLEERDRQIAKEAKRDDQTQRKYDRGLLKNDEAEVKAMRQLRSEQAALKFEVAQLSAQLATLAAAANKNDTERVVVQPAQPVVQSPQVVQQTPATDPVLVAELSGLRQELAALRQSMAARPAPTPVAAPVVVVPPTPATSPAPVPTTPTRNLDAEVLDVLSQYGSAQVFFETGKSSVISASMNSLGGLANGARQYPNRILVSLAGFTDKTGSLAANQALSQRRVEAVRLALINLGVSPSQISSSASGPDLNASDNASARRVEVTLRVR
jgi:outer membrane protein OmpA-like peptidoglycan-associated protein